MQPYKLLITVMIISCFTSIKLEAQDIPISPREVLKNWDYYTLTAELGEGIPIIDSLAGQAYISGMQYEDKWFQRTALVSFDFTDIKITGLRLRFWSPYIEQRTGGKISNITDPIIRDSLLREYQIQDSLRVDSVNRILQMDPNLIATMNVRAEQLNEVQKELYDLDSLRCDSLIFDMSQALGQTLRQDTTSHTEIARYSAIWIENGTAVSLKDYTDYTDVVFSIPIINEQIAVKFGLDPSSEIHEKMLIDRNNSSLEISLAVTPTPDITNEFTGINLLVENAAKQINVEKVSELHQISDPRISAMDFDNDGIQEIWIKFDVGIDSISRKHKIYNIEDEEPIIIFDSQIEIDEGIQIRLLHGTQLETTFADGTTFMHPLDKDNKAIQGKFNSNGALTGDDLVVTGNIKYLKISNPQEKYKILEGRIPLVVASNSQVLGDLIIHWKLDSGYWDILDFQITDQ